MPSSLARGLHVTSAFVIGRTRLASQKQILLKLPEHVALGKYFPHPGLRFPIREPRALDCPVYRIGE